MNKSIRVLGVDPGYAIAGYGVVDYDGSKFSLLEFGAVTTSPEDAFPQRLASISKDFQYILSRHNPHCLAIEKLFFNTNHKTAIDVAQARGVIILEAVKTGLEVSEYTPLQVKQAVTGYGKAEKLQVQSMIQRILKLSAIPKPDDTADALAIAICHAFTSYSRLKNL